MEIKNFRDELLEQVNLNAATEGTSEKEEFLALVMEMLTEAEEINDDFIYLPYEITGSKRRKIQIDGYCYNELDEYLSIFTSSPLSAPNDEVVKLTSTEAEKLFTRARSIIEDASFLFDNAEESAPGFGLVYDILHRYSTVKKYCIYLISDMEMSKNIKELDPFPINNIPVEYHIWDLSRLYQLSESKTGKEDIVINLKEFSTNGIPCLPASKTDDYTAYLCNIPGRTLATLYNTYGGRLLEGNVRSFLQTKGKVNSGIRNTIINNPNMFFAYNNGIAATAYDMRLENVDGILYITEITALQIVNGGQTTASLAAALINDKKDGSEESINKIFVPMKLSIVSPEKSQLLIPEISKFANRQNKVSDADLWSNNPFHVRMEEFSRRILTPTTHGKQYSTKWYYERANGQYRQETYKATDSAKKKFALQYPKSQFFNKTDLAKYMNIYKQLPHVASAGGQKSFARFAKWVIITWSKNENAINEGFFKMVIAIAILFRTSDKIVKNQTWYNSYKANIVAYTLSKIIFDVKQLYPEHAIDYRSIWQKQALSKAFTEQIEISSKIIYEFLIDPSRTVENVTEWAKRETCWERAKELKIPYSDEFVKELILKSQAENQSKTDKKEQKLTNKMNSMIGVANYGLDNWKNLLKWNSTHNALNPTEISFIKVALEMEKGKFPTEKQSVRILEVLEKARLEGYSK